MLKWLMNRAIAAFERQWNYDAGYVHEIIDASPKHRGPVMSMRSRGCWQVTQRS